MEFYDSIINSLAEAYKTQQQLYQGGSIADFVQKGSGQDKATRGDWESEETIIRCLKEDRVPIRIFSEEHGTIDVVKNPKYLAILDGWDGSSGLVYNPSSRGGTMLSIASSLNPRYGDFIFAGITEQINDKIVCGIKEEGVIEINYSNCPLERKFSSFSPRSFSPQTKICVDCYDVVIAEGVTAGMNDFQKFMNENIVKKLQGKVTLSGNVSSAAMCLDLLENRVDAVAQIVAKGVFEPPAMYFLTTLLGGYAVDFDGNDLGKKEWKPVGMQVDGVLFSSSREISQELLRLIKN